MISNNGNLRALYAIVAVVCIGLFAGISYVFTEQAGMPKVPATTLLLEEQYFPNGWQSSCKEGCDRSRYERFSFASRRTTGGNSRVIQEVYRERSVKDAQDYYGRFYDISFYKGSRLPSTDLRTPEGLTRYNAIGDESYFGCGRDLISTCRALIRYQNYVIYFSLSHEDIFDTEKELTLGEIEILMDRLVAQMDSAFGLPPIDPLQRASIASTPPFSPSPTPPKTLEGLLAALQDENAATRTEAAFVLSTMDELATSAVPILAANLNDVVPDVRHAAAYALGKLGPIAKPALPHLCATLLIDVRDEVRIYSAIALENIGEISAVPALMYAIYHPVENDPTTPVRAAEAVSHLSGENLKFEFAPGSARNPNGAFTIEMAAKSWWQSEGQYIDWTTSPELTPCTHPAAP